MAYSKKEIEEIFNEVCRLIAEEGLSQTKALNKIGRPCRDTFYKWLDNDKKKIDDYARACELRADNIFEDILSIADDRSQDVIVTDSGESFNGEFAARSRIKIDARKWMLSKMYPKKYGEKLDITTGGEKIIKGIKLD